MLKYQVSSNSAIASYLDSLYLFKYLEDGVAPYHASYNGVSSTKKKKKRKKKNSGSKESW
jgi:hypothetical protein